MGDDIIERFRLTWARAGGSEEMETVFEGTGNIGSVLESQLDVEEAHFVRPDVGIGRRRRRQSPHALDNVRSGEAGDELRSIRGLQHIDAANGSWKRSRICELKLVNDMVNVVGSANRVGFRRKRGGDHGCENVTGSARPNRRGSDRDCRKQEKGKAHKPKNIHGQNISRVKTARNTK